MERTIYPVPCTVMNITTRRVVDLWRCPPPQKRIKKLNKPKACVADPILEIRIQIEAVW
jgi:hypothetical protein